MENEKFRGRRRSALAVVAAAALLVVGASGGAVAGALVTSKQIKNNTIKSVDVRNGTLTGVDIRDGSVAGADVADGSLSGGDIADGSIGSADLARDARTHWVAVYGDGVVGRSSGGIGAAKVNVGRYNVTVPAGIDVRTCGLYATRGRVGNFNGTAGFISATPGYQDLPHQVWVETFNSAAAHADNDFYLLLDC